MLDRHAKFKEYLIYFFSSIFCFLSICAFNSPNSWRNPQIVGVLLYFIAGILYFKRRSFNRILLFFTPFLLPVSIMLTGNPDLFPLFIPILFFLCLGAFISGQYSRYCFTIRQYIYGGVTIILLASLSITVIFILTPILHSFRASNHFSSVVLPDKIELVNAIGDTIELEKDKVKVLDFWFFGCGNCYPNNDFINTVADKYVKSDVKFYLIDIGSVDSFEKFQKIDITKKNWNNLTHLYDPNGKLSKELRIDAAPRTVIIGGGKILYGKIGFSTENADFDSERMSKVIDEELGKVKNNDNDLKIDSSFDFGKVSINDTLIHTFKVTNLSSKPLVLSDIASTCNCSVTSWTKEPISRGGIGQVTVRFVTLDKGTFDKVIVIETNSVKKPFIVLHLKGET